MSAVEIEAEGVVGQTIAPGTAWAASGGFNAKGRPTAGGLAMPELDARLIVVAGTVNVPAIVLSLVFGL